MAALCLVFFVMLELCYGLGICVRNVLSNLKFGYQVSNYSGTDKTPRKNLTDSADRRTFRLRAEFQPSIPAFTYAKYNVEPMNVVVLF